MENLTYLGIGHLLGMVSISEIGLAFLSHVHDPDEGFPAPPARRKPVGAPISTWRHVQTFVMDDFCQKVLESGTRSTDHLEISKLWDESVGAWRGLPLRDDLSEEHHDKNIPLYENLSAHTKCRLILLVRFLSEWLRPMYIPKGD